MRSPMFVSSPRLRVALPMVMAVLLALPLAAQVGVAERVDLDAIYRIKEEGFQRSKVMEYASWLTDVYGPRLTNSPVTKQAADYVVQEMTALGLANAALEPWGPFGRGWVNDHVALHVVEPQRYPVLAFPKAWTPGTNGVVRGEVVHVTLESEADFEKHRGQLRGRFVAMSPLREVKPLFDPPGRRFTHEELHAMTEQRVGGGPQFQPTPEMRRQADFRAKRMAFLVEEGVAGILEPSPGDRGDSGSVRVQGPAQGEGSREPGDPPSVPQLVLAAEHYNRLLRTLDKSLPVFVEADVRNRFFDESLDTFNVVAEIPGTDKASEVVMIGAHFDSWHTGTGATDNGGSSAVVMEVMRILKATGLKPRRTIRLALWTGEEQGLLGSRAYVKKHFADRETMKLEPGHASFAAYFNMDNGGGKFRGIYLQGNEAVAPVFEAWMQPFHNLGMTTLTIRNTSGTDHLAFDAVGLPGFQFIQDPMEYSSRTHHTNLDVYERLVAEDLMKNAVIMASFAYHAAMRDEPLPRKPLPAPQPAQRPAQTTASQPR